MAERHAIVDARNLLDSSAMCSARVGGLQVSDADAVVVTGGSGFLGSHLCRTRWFAGWEVVAVDNFLTGRSARSSKT